MKKILLAVAFLGFATTGCPDKGAERRRPCRHL